MSQYHEPANELDKADRDIVRALLSLKEEVEAIDWYHQRRAVSDDSELTEILTHNMKEEMEHAAMSIEWLRRNMDGWDDVLRTYLMKSDPILELEEQAEAEDSASGATDLGVGGLKQTSETGEA